MQTQSALGNKVLNRLPDFSQTFLGRVTSVKDFDRGRVEIALIDGGTPIVASVVGQIARKPVEGDKVLISYISGRPDAPYLLGFVHKDSFSSDSIRVEKDKITVKLPNNAASVELSENGTVRINSKFGTTNAYINITASGIEIYHPNGVTMRSNNDSIRV